LDKIIVIDRCEEKHKSISVNDREALDYTVVCKSDAEREINIGSKSNINLKIFVSGNASLNLRAYLNGEDSKIELREVFLAEGENIKLITRIIHVNKNNKSKMLVKGVLKGRSSVFFDGNIVIGKKASNSEGFQKSEVLILGNNCEYKALPELEIENQNVKCGHAATIGRINKEMLFYLMSRGMSEKEAETEIVNGFLGDCLKDFVR